MLPDDLFLWCAPGAPALLPDGSAAVIAVHGPDAAADAVTGGLWLVPLDGGAPRVLTRGCADSAPQVSADGRWVVFIRRTADGPGQVHVVEAAGGEPVALTDAPLGAQQPVVSPDSRRVAYVARVPEPGRYERGGKPGAEPPRLVTELRYRADGLGYVRDRERAVFVVDLPPLASPGAGVPQDAPEPVRISPAGLDVDGPRWLPDGSGVTVVAARHGAREVDLRRDAVVLPVPPSPAPDVAAEEQAAPVLGAVRPVTDADAGSTLAVGAVLPDPDGARVWLLAADMGASGRDCVAALTGLFVLEVAADGTHVGAPVRLTDPERVDLDPGVLVAADGGVLVAPLREGAVHLVRVEPDATVAELLGGTDVVTSATHAAGRTVAVRATPDSAGDLVVVTDGGARGLTDLSARLRATGRLRRPQPVTALAPDGYRVEGWLTTPDPERFGAGPHPTILMIHGGPFAQYTHALFDEVQVLAAAGYAVVHGNPRGSAGRGRAHGRAIRHAFGTVDADDVLALLDHVLADERLDATRTGVMGGSYGGYLTAWLTTRTERFTAAIVERGFLDPVSFVGSSDIGWFFGQENVGDPAVEPELVAAQSPMAHVGAVRTPTLVIHSEQDWRCPVEQGQRWFTELRLRGVPAELLLFPGEGHELSRSGLPSHRVARFEHVLRWWARHLPVGPARVTADA